MNKFNSQLLLRYRWHLLSALLALFVMGLVYYANTKPVSNDLQSSTAIHEVSDYARDVEDNADDDSFPIIAALVDQPLQLDWSVILNTFIAQSNVSWFAYRARSRSPPAL